MTTNAQVIEKIYVTPPPSAAAPTAPSRASTAAPQLHVAVSTAHTATHPIRSAKSSHTTALVASDATLSTTRRTFEPVRLADLASRGWRFPPIALATADEQRVFEFEVTLRVRTTPEELVASCRCFRTELLRNVPVAVFLARPAILQHVLCLVQMPLIAGSDTAAASPTPLDASDATANAAMATALTLALGVNYFDDLGSPSFARKLRNVTTAVFLAALRAIEAVVHALARAMTHDLDPTFIAYDSVLAADVAGRFDGARRVLYPRAVPSANAPETASESAYSLSGAVFAICSSLVPLLASPRHPRIHVLNVLHAALPLLRERGVERTATESLESLDQRRVTQLLGLLGDFCFAKPLTLAQVVAECGSSVTTRLLELVVRLLQLDAPATYRVERLDRPEATDAVRGIAVPAAVWRFVQLCVASADVDSLATREAWDARNALDVLRAIDPTLSAFVESTRRVRSTARAVDEFLATARRLHAQPTSSSSGSSDEALALRLDVAHHVANRLATLDECDVDSAVDGLLVAIWTAAAASSSTGPLALDAAASIRAIVLRVVDIGAQRGGVWQLASLHLSKELARVVCDGKSPVRELSSASREHFAAIVLCDAVFFAALLLRAAALIEQCSDAPASSANAKSSRSEDDGVWTLVTLVNSAFAAAPDAYVATLAPVIPLLQHVAFVEPPETLASSTLRQTQPQLMALLNRVEKTLPSHARLLLMLRCLLHTSAYIRRAAASGVLRLVAETEPAAFERIATSRASSALDGDDESNDANSVVTDPFSPPPSASSSRSNTLSPLLQRLLATALPSVSDVATATNAASEITPRLAKLAALRRLLTASRSSVPEIRAPAVRELVLFVDSLSPTQFGLLEELNEVEAMTDALLAHVASDASDATFIESVLVLLRNLLLRSERLRQAMRTDTAALRLLVPLVFDTRVTVRAQMFYVVVLLTLSLDAFAAAAPVSRTMSTAAVPVAAIAQSFGLYASKWRQCEVPTCLLASLLESQQEHQLQTNDSDAVVETPQASTGASDDGEDSDAFTPLQDVAYVLERLERAPSHSQFLNALYYVLQLTHASPTARSHVAASWERVFARYVAVPPQTERDEVVVASVLSCLDALLIADTSRAQQLRLLLVIKRSFVPLLERATSPALSLALVRVLLHVRVSRVADLFLTLAFDTNVLDVLCLKYASVYVTHSLLHALALELVLRFATSAREHAATCGADDASALYTNVIIERLGSLVAPLVSVLSRHRVPGSFLDRDVFAMAAQTLAAIVAVSPHAALRGDSSWSSRLLFDHTSHMRALGYRLAAASVAPGARDDNDSSGDGATETRLLQLALETSMDATECDAVRGAACSVLHAALLRVSSSSHSDNHDAQQQQRLRLASVLCSSGRDAFAANAVRALVAVGQDDKLLVTCGLRLTQLLRLLLVQRSALAMDFGDVVDALAAASDETDVFPVLVQVRPVFSAPSVVQLFTDSAASYRLCL